MSVQRYQYKTTRRSWSLVSVVFWTKMRLDPIGIGATPFSISVQPAAGYDVIGVCSKRK